MTDWIDASVRDFLRDAFPKAMRIARDHGLPNDYSAGERPRHFAGALDTPERVELLLLTAEPGSRPYDWERGRPTDAWLDDVTSDGLGRRGGHPFVYDPAHVFDARYEDTSHAVQPAMFLAQVWPELSVEERMARTVVANSFWMQATYSTDNVPRPAEREFAPILAGFVDLFPNAIVVAAGNKPRDRLKLASRRAVHMRALFGPGYTRGDAAASRASAAAMVRKGSS